MLKIGIYGGSFDPPHMGHKKIVEYVVNKLDLDKLIIIPVGKASHGKDKLTEGNLRYEMCKLNFENIKGTEISRIEIDSDEISYTYKTLRKIRNLYGEENQYFEIIGEDSAAYFNKWKNYEEILDKSKIVVLKRKGYESIIKNEKVIELENEYYNISSSEIKKNFEKNEEISGELTKEVQEFIMEKKLYQNRD